MECYKVTREDNKSIVSEDDAAVYYLNGEYVTAPEYLAEQGYHLTAFQTLKDAKEAAKYYFWADSENVIIWKALGKAKIKELPSICTRRSVEYKGKSVQAIGGRNRWPKNTLMFKKLKLVKIAERLS